MKDENQKKLNAIVDDECSMGSRWDI